MNIDLNLLGNKIKNEKMRNAFFIYCADVATYIADSHEKDDDESWSVEEHASFLIDETTKLVSDIKREILGDSSEIMPYVYPFDIGHRMIHIMVKKFEKDSKEEENVIKTFNYLSDKESGKI